MASFADTRRAHPIPTRIPGIYVRRDFPKSSLDEMRDLTDRAQDADEAEAGELIPRLFLELFERVIVDEAGERFEDFTDLDGAKAALDEHPGLYADVPQAVADALSDAVGKSKAIRGSS